MLRQIKRGIIKHLIGYDNPKKYWNYRWKLTKATENIQYWSHLFSKVQRLMNIYKCKSILDIGCGPAKLKTLKGYIGLDFSIESLKRSKLKSFILADITNKIPLPDNSIDMIFIRNVLIHIKPEELPKAIQEIIRISKTCIVIAETPSKSTQDHCFRHNYHSLFKDYEGELIFLDSEGNIRN